MVFVDWVKAFDAVSRTWLQKQEKNTSKKKTWALLELHAFFESDTTGALSKKAKVSFWEAFKKADEQILAAISKLGVQ